MKQFLKGLKNLPGWRTQRTLVAFAVDDYANVRVASPDARQRLLEAGLDLSGQMDRYDTLETRQDLEALYQVLDSVHDANGNPAVFTAYALSANPDFEQIRAQGDGYYPEDVPNTFARLERTQPDAYAGTWELWQEGMEKGWLRPQFHGREHLNVTLFEHKLRTGAPDLKASLENDSLAGIRGDESMPHVGFSHAFGLQDEQELKRQREFLADGLDQFERIYGFRSTTFTPPAMQLHPGLYSCAESGGVISIDKPFLYRRHHGDGKFKREINRSGKQRGQKHLTVVRNVVFEPCKKMGFEPVDRALQQIEAAFRWRKPAIVSSHRVNFCGHLDQGNREKGLSALKALLDRITDRWPEVEFVSVDRIVESMSGRTD